MVNGDTGDGMVLAEPRLPTVINTKANIALINGTAGACISGTMGVCTMACSGRISDMVGANSFGPMVPCMKANFAMVNEKDREPTHLVMEGDTRDRGRMVATVDLESVPGKTVVATKGESNLIWICHYGREYGSLVSC